MLDNLLKYLLEGLAIATACYIVCKKTKVEEIFLIALSGAATFAVLDLLAPNVSDGARLGAGFGLGAQHVGFGEGFMPESYNMHESLSLEDDGAYQEQQPNLSDMVNEAENIQDSEELNNVVANVDLSGADLGDSNELLDTILPSDATPPRVQENAPESFGIEGFSNCSVSTHARGIYGFKTVESFTVEDDKYERESNVIHSGDIIDIMNDEKGDYIQREISSSDVKLREKINENVTTNLSHLRFVSAIADPNKQTKLTYGSKIHIMHNAIVNGVNKNLYIKIGKKLHSHQSNKSFSEFKLINQKNPEDTGVVRYGDTFYIYNYTAGGIPAGILALDSETKDGSIVSKPMTTATASVGDVGGIALTAVLRRTYELNNKNLCVCPGSTLFP